MSDSEAKAKKAKAAHNKSVRRTGGGPPDTPIPPELERQNEELLSEKDMELPHLPGEHIPEGIPDPSTVITKESTKNIGSTYAPQKLSKKDPRSMLVELESKEHDERMKNLRKKGQILDCELQIKRRKLEMMKEEHALKIEVLRIKLKEWKINSK
ncbi:unnamed protein product [Orchesella dallaii]|uniref:Uncharacterized protein n=1 Tax=Orchesella dallaii TaxID=48710 RepID=A0ABP1QQP3_9HEXA